MRFALLPAAGQSTRMGRPKLTMPLGKLTILELVLAALRQAQVQHILVVTGPNAGELPALAERGVNVLQLIEQTADMRATVEHGLHWLEEQFQPCANDLWLLIPADHPALEPKTIRALDQAAVCHPESSIYVPTYQGKRGHPLSLTWRHVAGMRAHPAGEGLNTYIRKHTAETLEVPVDSETILWDLDTPDDYERLWRAAPFLEK